ncbi:MAG: alanine dehydrogenase [Thermoguttaceae bacterium]|jgi:alanine dehydrogenase
MIIGVPREIKNQEFRVAATPAGVFELAKRGHKVLVEKDAGLTSGFTDESYVNAGAYLADTSKEIFERADIIVKVKEPLPSEYPMIRKNQVLFAYFHFASDLELLRAMMLSGAICIAYETVQKSDRSLPLLEPMSEVAGRSSIQVGVAYLKKSSGGKGILLGGVPGVLPGKVLVLGGGVVGLNAAKFAAGFGADVVVSDISIPRLRQLHTILPPNVKTLYASEYNIRAELPDADLIIGAVLVPGGKTPHLVTRDMLHLMEPGTVMVDVAIDQGGCFESSHPTSHDNPIFIEQEIIHYCVTNIPGVFPRTSTQALTNATLPYLTTLADIGWEKACEEDTALKSGLNVIDGKVVCSAVAEAWDL